MCFSQIVVVRIKNLNIKIDGFFQKLTHLPAPIAGSA